MSKTLSWESASRAPRPLSATLLYLVALALRGSSEMLERLAARQTASHAKAAAGVYAGAVEYEAVYRDAGAPEGALYINGELVGYIDGVTRL